jgi:hypothetical protein
MTSDAATAYERRCRLLMRLAYPPRFREFRGTELLSTLMDLAEPDQSSPTLRDGLDVLRGGLILRLRERPPVRHWLLYRVLGWRLPWNYRWWARDDIQGRFFLERHLLSLLLSWSLYLALVRSSTPFLIYLVVFGVAYLLLLPVKARLRRLTLAKHGFHPDGTSYVPIPPEARPNERAYAPKPDEAHRMKQPGQ